MRWVAPFSQFLTCKYGAERFEEVGYWTNLADGCKSNVNHRIRYDGTIICYDEVILVLFLIMLNFFINFCLCYKPHVNTRFSIGIITSFRGKEIYQEFEIDKIIVCIFLNKWRLGWVNDCSFLRMCQMSEFLLLPNITLTGTTGFKFI